MFVNSAVPRTVPTKSLKILAHFLYIFFFPIHFYFAIIINGFMFSSVFVTKLEMLLRLELTISQD